VYRIVRSLEFVLPRQSILISEKGGENFGVISFDNVELLALQIVVLLPFR